MPMWGATGKRGRAPRGRYAQRKRVRRFPYVSMGSLKALAKGGIGMYGYKKRTSSKKKYTSSKKRMSKGPKTRAKVKQQRLLQNPKTASLVNSRIAKMPDQRLTRMEFKTGILTPYNSHFPSDKRLMYTGFQNTGGYLPHLKTVAGSIIRDICGKNGLKFPSWNTGITAGTSSQVIGSVVRKQIYSFRIYYRGDNDGATVEEPGTVIQILGASPTFPVRTLWEISKDLASQLYDYAQCAMYPFASETLVYDDDFVGAARDNVIKFRDDNFGNSSVTVRVRSDTIMTNETPSRTGNLHTDAIDTVPLSVKRFSFRNLAPELSDSVITASKNTLNFKNVSAIADSDLDDGVLNLSSLYSTAEGDYFNPFKTIPQGKVVFKNLKATGSFMMRPGQSTTQKTQFSFVGTLAKYLESTISKKYYVTGTAATINATTGVCDNGFTKNNALKAVRLPAGGESHIYAFQRIRRNFTDTETITYDLKIAFAIRHMCEAYVQPFKAVPLPVCRADTNGWDTNPGNVLG